MCFRTRGRLSILLGEDADDACSDFVVNDGDIVFADDVDAEFLDEELGLATGL